MPERDAAIGQRRRYFRELREALFGMGRNHVTGSQFRERDVDVLNRLALGPVLPATMDVSGTPVPPVLSVEQALAHIAREVIARFTGPLRGRVRECAAADCQLLFVDASRPGHRQ